MRAYQAFPSRFLKAASLNNRPALRTISEVREEEINGDNKHVVYFEEGPQGLVLNLTNWESIEDLHGDSNDWPGKVVELFPDKTKYQGKPVPCIRIRTATQSAPTKKAAAKAPAPPADDDPVWDDAPPVGD